MAKTKNRLPISEALLLVCEPECVRFSLAQPFNQHGHTIATNGRILIRTKVDSRFIEQAKPDCIAMLTALDGATWQPIPSEIPDGGEYHPDCERCGGDGYIKTTAGKYISCSKCKGFGSVVVKLKLLLGNEFDPKLLSIATEAGATECAIDDDMLMFRGEGFDGCLMSVRTYRI